MSPPTMMTSSKSMVEGSWGSPVGGVVSEQVPGAGRRKDGERATLRDTVNYILFIVGIAREGCCVLPYFVKVTTYYTCECTPTSIVYTSVISTCIV